MKPLACLFAICFFFSTPVIAAPPPLVVKNVSTPFFSGLVIQGPVNVIIDTQTQIKPSTPSLQVFGDPKTVAAVNWKIKNHILYLGTKWTYWPRKGDRLSIRLNITPSQLNQINFNSNGSLFGKGLTGTLSLTATGEGCIKLCTKKLDLKSLYAGNKVNITLHNIVSSNLTIQNESAGKIRLGGDIALHKLNVTGNGDLNIYWLDSPYLQINGSGNGRIFLAGITKNLDVNLSKKTHLFAKQLRSDNGFIKTKNQAYAEVTIKNKLSALAKDASIIYYSTPVNFLNTYTETSGLVLANTG